MKPYEKSAYIGAAACIMFLAFCINGANNRADRLQARVEALERRPPKLEVRVYPQVETHLGLPPFAEPTSAPQNALYRPK